VVGINASYSNRRRGAKAMNGIRPTLSEDIQAAINSHNGEARSNTPDFILAEYLMACLHAFEAASNERERWYEMYCEPGGTRSTRKETVSGQATADSAEPVRYGCHCEVDATLTGEPDSCVFDDGDVDDCVYATQLDRQNKGKKDCQYWKPIRTTVTVSPEGKP
jgi:hypothetical protein